MGETSGENNNQCFLQSFVSSLYLCGKISSCLLSRIRVISYNQEASQVALTGESQVDKASIDKIRASGSTSFVAVFKHLSAIFKDKTEDASKAFFVFFMTDGEDTVSSPKEIMQQKELMQTDIEKFGAEVVFHVLGFSEQHDEQFLESLTFLGTSDGTYSFVSPSEGGKAIEERLIALVQSTSSAVGRSLNIEMKSNDLLFLGDTFGEGKAEVVVPAMVSKNNGVVRIATKKFVKRMPTCKGSQKLDLKIYEKLTGAPKAIEAKVVTLEEVVLKEQVHVADHNLVKMRAALNMITGQISEADKPEQVEGMKVWHKLVQEKFAKITLDESKASLPMKNRIKAVRSGIEICSEVYEDEGISAREKGMKQQEAMTKYQVSISLIFHISAMSPPFEHSSIRHPRLPNPRLCQSKPRTGSTRRARLPPLISGSLLKPPGDVCI